METYQGSGYADCPKCGVRHSTLVKHKCFKPEEQKEKPPVEDYEEEADGSGWGGEDGTGKSQDSESDHDQDKGKGKGQSDGQGKSGQGEQDGEGEGEEEGEAKQKAPQPKPPEKKDPPVVVVCTVLKFAALTAQCAKNGNIELTVTEDGIFVYGYNGDNVAHDTIPWGEFEQRATIDGEFYVKGIIDAVDEKLADPKSDAEALKRAIAKAKDEAKAEPEAKPKGAGRKAKVKKAEGGSPLTLPLIVGQRVICRDGTLATVKEVSSAGVARYDNGHGVLTENGCANITGGQRLHYDAVADQVAEAPDWSRRLFAVYRGKPYTVTGHRPAGKTVEWDYAIDFENELVALLKADKVNSSKGGYCYRSNGRHSDKPEKMPVIVNVEGIPDVLEKSIFPLVLGQKVLAYNGDVGEVVKEGYDRNRPDISAVRWNGEGTEWWHRKDNGKFDRSEFDQPHRLDIVA